MTKDEALKLAQDYLTDHQIGVHIIAAIKQALANEALDKMAENARELGLDYEPAPVLYQLPDDLYDSKDWKVGSYAERVEWLHTMYEAKKRELEYCLDAAPVQEPVAWMWTHKTAGKVGVYFEHPSKFFDLTKPSDYDWTPLYTTPPAAQDLQTELEATNRQVEILSDALAESRREVAAQRQWVHATPWRGLTDAEILEVLCIWPDPDDDPDDYMEDIREARAIEAKLKEKNV